MLALKTKQGSHEPRNAGNFLKLTMTPPVNSQWKSSDLCPKTDRNLILSTIWMRLEESSQSRAFRNEHNLANTVIWALQDPSLNNQSRLPYFWPSEIINLYRSKLLSLWWFVMAAIEDWNTYVMQESREVWFQVWLDPEAQIILLDLVFLFHVLFSSMLASS